MNIDLIQTALSEVVDPEVGLNVVDLGLIYDIDLSDNKVHITMTLTSPACPMGAQVRASCQAAVQKAVGPDIPVDVDVVWEPAWTPERMSAHARQQLGVD